MDGYPPCEETEAAWYKNMSTLLLTELPFKERSVSNFRRNHPAVRKMVNAVFDGIAGNLDKIPLDLNFDVIRNTFWVPFP